MPETVEQVALVVRMWCFDRVRENALEVLQSSNLLGFTDADLERLQAAIHQGKKRFDEEVEALKKLRGEGKSIAEGFSSKETLAIWLSKNRRYCDVPLARSIKTQGQRGVCQHCQQSVTLIVTPGYKLEPGKRRALGLKVAGLVTLIGAPMIPWVIWRPSLTLAVAGLIAAFGVLVYVARKAAANDWLRQVRKGVVRTQCELQEPANHVYRHGLRDPGTTGERAFAREVPIVAEEEKPVEVVCQAAAGPKKAVVSEGMQASSRVGQLTFHVGGVPPLRIERRPCPVCGVQLEFEVGCGVELMTKGESGGITEMGRPMTAYTHVIRGV